MVRSPSRSSTELTYVEHEIDHRLAEVRNSPLACRRAVYRWRQMLRGGELHCEGWRDIIMPIVGLADAISDRAKGTGPEHAILPTWSNHLGGRSEIAFTRAEVAKEIRWLVPEADKEPGEWERQGLRESLRISPMSRSRWTDYELRSQPVSFHQLVVVAGAVLAARQA